MFPVGRRNAVCEKQTAIGEVGETEPMFPVQTLDFAEGARGIGGGWEEFEGGEGDCGG